MKLTEKDYEEMAADYAAHPVTADELIGDIEVRDPVVLRKGRPVGGRKQGKSPGLSVRFPDDLRKQLDARAKKDKTGAAEVVRRAVAQYLDAS